MLIAVEGCVGAGKSTVAKGLAAYRKSEVLLESFESNPFLAAFYEDPIAYAAETEITFLCLHAHQLKLRAAAISKNEVITDFHLAKDLLYGKLNLKDPKLLRIFTQLHDVFADQVSKPAVMVCLSASTDLLISRIRSRKREFELKIDRGYYAEVNAAYESYFDRYSGCKLRISMDENDFLAAPDLYHKLSLRIDEHLESM